MKEICQHDCVRPKVYEICVYCGSSKKKKNKTYNSMLDSETGTFLSFNV